MLGVALFAFATFYLLSLFSLPPRSVSSVFSVAPMHLPLLQVILDQRRLLRQELRVLVRRLEEAGQALGRLLEALGELALLLVAPGLLQGPHLPVQAGH